MLLACPWGPVGAQGGARPDSAPPGVLVDIGGYRLHLHCSGSGSPVVLLEAGAGDFSSDWSLVQPAVSQVTRVCSYDRAGYAWSDAGPLPRTIRQVTSELHAMIGAAGLPAPLVLVGHSLGGLYARAFAAAHPDQVAGVVLIDAAHEDNPILLNGREALLRATSRGRDIPAPRLQRAADELIPENGPPQTRAPELMAPFDRLPSRAQEARRWAMARPGFSGTRASEFDYLPEELALLEGPPLAARLCQPSSRARRGAARRRWGIPGRFKRP
jgi:pimeloyl-ACP methyl ester carboxylesterase